MAYSFCTVHVLYFGCNEEKANTYPAWARKGRKRDAEKGRTSNVALKSPLKSFPNRTQTTNKTEVPTILETTGAHRIQSDV